MVAQRMTRGAVVCRAHAPGVGERLARHLGGELQGEEVLGRGGHEHGGGVRAALELRLDEEGAELAGGGAGEGAGLLGEGGDDGEEHAAGAGGGAGHRGGDERLGRHEAVREAEGRLAHGGDEHIRDAVAEAGLDEAAGGESGRRRWARCIS